MQSWIVSIIALILICWSVAQETIIIIIINVENNF